MPTVYVSANFNATVNLSKDDDFVFGEWTDKKLAKKREGYDNPNLGIWLQITNPENEIEIFPIPVTEKDVYEGNLSVTRDDRKFSFNFNGKAKVNIHKSTKEKLDAGLVPRVSGLMINGQQYDTDLVIEANIQSKKI